MRAYYSGPLRGLEEGVWNPGTPNQDYWLPSPLVNEAARLGKKGGAAVGAKELVMLSTRSSFISNGL
jgi:hypothetical protein